MRALLQERQDRRKAWPSVKAELTANSTSGKQELGQVVATLATVGKGAKHVCEAAICALARAGGVAVVGYVRGAQRFGANQP